MRDLLRLRLIPCFRLDSRNEGGREHRAVGTVITDPVAVGMCLVLGLMLRKKCGIQPAFVGSRSTRNICCGDTCLCRSRSFLDPSSGVCQDDTRFVSLE